LLQKVALLRACFVFHVYSTFSWPQVAELMIICAPFTPAPPAVTAAACMLLQEQAALAADEQQPEQGKKQKQKPQQKQMQPSNVGAWSCN
jgi:hypothetical protein